jgi:hypothetical protein
MGFPATGSSRNSQSMWCPTNMVRAWPAPAPDWISFSIEASMASWSNRWSRKHMSVQGQHLQLACLHHPLNVYSHPGQSLQILVPILGSHDVSSLFTPVKAILVEEAKHPVLLVEAIEERANMSVRPDAGAGTLQEIAVRRHVSPPVRGF